MHLADLALTAAAWLIALAWLFKLVEAARGLPSVPNLLAPEYDRMPAGNPSIATIVPSRNEAPNIAACLESLLAQDYPNLHIFAINDRSTDQTGSIMDSLASAHSTRLEVLHIEELPPNWLGKNHAMAFAANHAISKVEFQPDYLLFTDADVVFRPDTIRRALAYVVSSNADHFVVLPTTVFKSCGEAMMLSYLQVISLWAVRPWRVADPKALRDAVGVGAFNLIRASVYRELGGFETAPMEILDDLYLGRRVKQARLRQRVAFAPGMVTVHWAPGAFGIVHGLTKNMFAVFRFRPAYLFGAAVSLFSFSIAPILFLLLGATRIPACIALASIAGLYTLSSRTSRISPVYAALSPVAAALILYSMLRSMWITLRAGGVTWRGTFYPLSELRHHADRAL